MSFEFPGKEGSPAPRGKSGPGLMFLLLIVAGVFFFMNSNRPNAGGPAPGGDGAKTRPQGRYYDDPETESVSSPGKSSTEGTTPINKSDWDMESVSPNSEKAGDNEVDLKLNQPGQPATKKSGDWEIDTNAGQTPSTNGGKK